VRLIQLLQLDMEGKQGAARLLPFDSYIKDWTRLLREKKTLRCNAFDCVNALERCDD